MSRPNITVRLASTGDAAELVRMGRNFHAASGDPAEFCSRSVVSTFENLLRLGFVLIAEEAETAIGMIAIAVTPLFFNQRVTFAQELAWWVDEDRRRGGAALALIREAESEARRRGASRIYMLRLAGSPAHVERIYTRLGYTPGEATHVKEL